MLGKALSRLMVTNRGSAEPERSVAGDPCRLVCVVSSLKDQPKHTTANGSCGFPRRFHTLHSGTGARRIRRAYRDSVRRTSGLQISRYEPDYPLEPRRTPIITPRPPRAQACHLPVGEERAGDYRWQLFQHRPDRRQRLHYAGLCHIQKTRHN